MKKINLINQSSLALTEIVYSSVQLSSKRFNSDFIDHLYELYIFTDEQLDELNKDIWADYMDSGLDDLGSY